MAQPAALVVKQGPVQAMYIPLAGVPLALRRTMCRVVWELQ